MLPYLYIFCVGLFNTFQPEGIEFFMDAKVYGFEAFVATVILYSAVFWYVGIICLILFIISLIRCKQINRSK